MPELKRKIIVYAPVIKLGLRDLMNANVLESLNREFNIHWYLQQSNDKIPFFTEENTSILYMSPTRQFLWSFLFEIENYIYNREKIGSKQSFPFLGMGRKQIVILKLIIKFRLTRIFKGFLKCLLRLSVPSAPSFFQDSELVICFGSSKDPFFDDIVRIARKNHIRIVMVSLNWDNATSKPYIEKPDLILSWGKQTASLSEKLHGIKSRPIGTPRYESYKSIEIFDKDLAKLKVGLESHFRYILFAGVGFPFPEIEVLNRLSEYLESTCKPDYRIIYRPHPFGWKRENANKTDSFAKYVILDPTLELFDPEDPMQYRYLFSACDGLVSAYSTMMVEAALHGIPMLAIAFNDGTDKYFNWVNHADVAPHLQILKENSSVIRCHELGQLKTAFSKLLEATNNLPWTEANDMAMEIVHLPQTLYADLLNNEINTLIQN